MTYDEIKLLPDSDKVQAMAANGVTKRSIEAVLKRPLNENEDQIFRRCQAERVLNGKSRRNAKSSNGEALSGAERKRRSLEREASIDEELDKAIEGIDWKRRLSCDTVEKWMITYCMEEGHGLITDPPSPRLSKALVDMQTAVGDASTPFHVRISRGFGKTSLSEGTCANAAVTGKRKFVVVFSAAKPDAVQICMDIFNVFLYGEAFLQDYPEVAVPLRWFNGSWKRRQHYNGQTTGVKFSQTRGFTLPTIVAKRDVPQLGIKAGEKWPSSGCTFSPRGFEGHARGMKIGSTRPDLILLDDLQDEENAANQEVVAKMVKNIRRTILNLGGKRKISVLMTSTPIEKDDLSETFANDPEWKTTTYRAFEKWPTEWIKNGMDGHWGEYIKLYRHALNVGSKNPLRQATAYYRKHRKAMDRGADTLNPQRFDAKAGQISGVQALMDQFYKIGSAAFSAEFQMQPVKASFAFEISSQLILSRIRRGLAPRTVPDGAVLVVATTDINPSYALTTAVTAFWPDRTAAVIGHVIEKIHISDRENDTAYASKIYDAVSAHGRKIAALGLPIRFWGIDAGGKQFAAVTSLAAANLHQHTLPFAIVAMVGRGEARQWNPFVKSRIREAVNNTVLCQDPQTRYEFLAWNADSYKETAQRSWATEAGSPGGLSLYDADMSEHEEFALQVANERLVSKTAVSTMAGRFSYKWQTMEPHDFGDCVAMAYALAGANNISAGGALPSVKLAPKRRKVIYRYAR